jgi:asparagine synthase (glutamine-hydrolysing)
MCGIVGIVADGGITERRWLVAGRDAMRHRGPDDRGEWWSPDGRAGLAHRRLAIIDVSPAGHQPMLDRAGNLAIVFNGEIYNFRELRAELRSRGHAFVSGSDTEVILAAYREWDTACVPRLEGMFALALYDIPRGRLLLARDRAGEKPLYYTQLGGSLRFASELKALLADASVSRRLDRQALDCYLADGFIPGARCILQGMQKLAPAHALTFDVATRRSEVWRYWQIPPAPDESVATVAEDSLLETLEQTLERAVRRQLVSDVPVGVLLSGGVDSSLVTAFAVRASPAVKTFTVRFPGYGTFDETEHARLIAQHFGTTHIEIEAGVATTDTLSLLARQFDEPMTDSSMVPTYLLSRAVREHCTVALGGDGGDELFGGYPHYDRMLWMQRHFGRVPRALRACVARAADHLPVGLRGRNWLQSLGTDFADDVPLVTQMFDRASRRKLLGRSAAAIGVAERVRRERMPRERDVLQRATRLDFENYLAEDILVKVDRASMLTSLEVRAPLLDVELLEFAFGKVPAALKVTTTGRKLLLKKLAARLLPPAFDSQRKQGFSIPLSAWLSEGPWRDFFRAVLLDAGQVCFDHRFIERMFAAEGRGRVNAERLFGLVLFELWRREYRPDVGV